MEAVIKDDSNRISTSLTTTNAFDHPILKSSKTKNNDRAKFSYERDNNKRKK